MAGCILEKSANFVLLNVCTYACALERRLNFQNVCGVLYVNVSFSSIIRCGTDYSSVKTIDNGVETNLDCYLDSGIIGKMID